MARTIRIDATGTTRDGRIVRTVRRPTAPQRRQGTRSAVVAAALADYFA